MPEKEGIAFHFRELQPVSRGKVKSGDVGSGRIGVQGR